MQQSAMSPARSRPSGGAVLADHRDDESRLRRTVIAGPGGPVEIHDTILNGVLARMADETTISAGLATAGHTDKRRRVLTGLVTVTAILGLCLFRRDSYSLVIARILPTSPRQILDGGPPTGQALSTARTRLPPMSMQAVFTHTAAVMPAAGPGSHAFGLLLTAFDGTVLDLPATGDIAAEFATPTGGKYPQARLVTLVACGTRWIIAAAQGSSALSEQHLVDTLADTLQPGTLNLADRNLCATRRFIAFPVQPGGIGGTFLDPMAYPDPKGNGDHSMPAKTGDRVQTDGAMRRGVRVIWLRLDCLNSNLQWRQGPARRKVVCNRRRPPCIRIKIARCSFREADNVQRGRVRR